MPHPGGMPWSAPSGLDAVTGLRRRRPAGRLALKVMVCAGSEWVGPRYHRGTAMEHYAGIDVSLERSSVCVVDSSGRIIREIKVASEPEALDERLSEDLLFGALWRRVLDRPARDLLVRATVLRAGRRPGHQPAARHLAAHRAERGRRGASVRGAPSGRPTRARVGGGRERAAFGGASPRQGFPGGKGLRPQELER